MSTLKTVTDYSESGRYISRIKYTVLSNFIKLCNLDLNRLFHF